MIALRESVARLRDRAERGALKPHELVALESDPRASVRALAARLARQKEAVAVERRRLRTMQKHERMLWKRGIVKLAGVDEVGAGPLAGPVVAAAVVLPRDCSIPFVNDSKELSKALRESLAADISACALGVGFGLCTVDEIDALNIYAAARESMRRAVQHLVTQGCAPEHLLVDARTVPGVEVDQTPLVKGDRCSHSIAAASIVAKVERDRMMVALAEQYPGYGFERHKGYGTAGHLKALAKLGPCDAHRRSFGPVAAFFRGTVSRGTP